MTTQKNIEIKGVGKCLPEKTLTNQDFVKMGLDTSDDWIKTRTGISTRHICDEKTATSDLATKAGLAAITSAKLTPSDIDLVIVATTTPDHLLFPSTACIVQKNLNLTTAAAFDISAACTGFNVALTTGSAYLQAGLAKNALIIGADSLSKWTNWKDRSTCVLFGDGAGAVVISKTSQNTYGLLASELHADGNEGNILITKSGGTRSPFSASTLTTQDHTIHMEGKSVFKAAIQNIIPCITSTLKKADLGPNDINMLIPHQANIRIINKIKEKLNLEEKQVMITLDKYANTSAASIPISLAEAVETQRIKKDDLLVLAGFGGGFTWGVNIIKWRPIT